MQMGRWFGDREGYKEDMVRLFIGTREAINKRGEQQDRNIQKLRRKVCARLHEEKTRVLYQKRYASLKEPRVLPRQVQPLVASPYD